MYRAQFSRIGEYYGKSAYVNIMYNEQRDEYVELVRSIMDELSSPEKNNGRFESRLNRDFDDVMFKIRKDFSGFEENSFRLLSYMVAGFKDSIIARIMNEKNTTVRVRKSRLRKLILESDSSNIELYRLFFSKERWQRLLFFRPGVV